MHKDLEDCFNNVQNNKDDEPSLKYFIGHLFKITTRNLTTFWPHQPSANNR